MKCKDTSTQVGALISLSAASDVSHSVLPTAHSPLSPSVFVFREQIIPRLCVCLHLSERSRERAADTMQEEASLRGRELKCSD